MPEIQKMNNILTFKELLPTLNKQKTEGNRMFFFLRKRWKLCFKYNCLTRLDQLPIHNVGHSIMDLCETGTSTMIREEEMNVPFNTSCILFQISSLGDGHTCLVLLVGIIINY